MGITFENVQSVVGSTIEKLIADDMLSSDEVGALTIDEIAIEICEDEDIECPSIDDLWG